MVGGGTDVGGTVHSPLDRPQPQYHLLKPTVRALIPRSLRRHDTTIRIWAKAPGTRAGHSF
eukprot:1469129-Prymnesium_polylepis.1